MPVRNNEAPDDKSSNIIDNGWTAKRDWNPDRIVVRVDLLDEIESRVEELFQGNLDTLLITGPEGVGKTLNVKQAVESACTEDGSANVTVLENQSSHDDRRIALKLLQELSEKSPTELRELSDQKIQTAIRSATERRTEDRFIFVLDDYEPEGRSALSIDDEYIPDVSSIGMLITSRNPPSLSLSEDQTIFPIPQYTESELYKVVAQHLETMLCRTEFAVEADDEYTQVRSEAKAEMSKEKDYAVFGSEIEMDRPSVNSCGQEYVFYSEAITMDAFMQIVEAAETETGNPMSALYHVRMAAENARAEGLDHINESHIEI